MQVSVSCGDSSKDHAVLNRRDLASERAIPLFRQQMVALLRKDSNTGNGALGLSKRTGRLQDSYIVVVSTLMKTEGFMCIPSHRIHLGLLHSPVRCALPLSVYEALICTNVAPPLFIISLALKGSLPGIASAARSVRHYPLHFAIAGTLNSVLIFSRWCGTSCHLGRIISLETRGVTPFVNL